MAKNKKFKVIFEGVYSDMSTFADIVEADNVIDALLQADGSEYVFDEDMWDEDTVPKTLEEAKEMARGHDRIITVTEMD